MSHVAKIQVQIKSLEALQAACDRLGLVFIEGQQNYKWFGKYMGDSKLPEGFSAADLGKCTHAIKVPGASYEIGVVQSLDGQWHLLWDSWRTGGLVKILGQNAEHLVQAYSIEAARLAAQAQGYSCYEEPLEDGTVKLHVTV